MGRGGHGRSDHDEGCRFSLFREFEGAKSRAQPFAATLDVTREISFAKEG